MTTFFRPRVLFSQSDFAWRLIGCLNFALAHTKSGCGAKPGRADLRYRRIAALYFSPAPRENALLKPGTQGARSVLAGWSSTVLADRSEVH